MILITGGTGFVGRRVVSALAARGDRVAVLTRASHVAGFPTSIDVRRGDLLDPASLGKALEGVAIVIHLAAALPGERRSSADILAVNVEGTANLARAARQRGVMQLIHASSAGVYGDGATDVPRSESTPPAPASVYVRSKLEGEHSLVSALETAVRWTILRPAGIHGPGRIAAAYLCRRVLRRPLWLHGPARVLVHPTYVGDVVTAIVQTIGRTDLGGEIINVGGGRRLTYPDLIDLIASRLGTRVHQLQPAPGLVRAITQVALRASAPWGRSRRLERLAMPVVNRTVDISKAQRLLQFEPYPLEAGLDETIAWARSEHLL